MPLQVIMNRCRHCDLTQSDTVKAVCAGDECAVNECTINECTVGECTDDDHFEYSLPERVRIEDYINIDVVVAMAGSLTGDEIEECLLGASDNESLGWQQHM